MKAKSRQIILLAALVFGAVWAILCLAGALPISKWPFATGIVCLGSLVTQIHILFPSLAPKEEKPADTEAVRRKDRIFAGLLIGAAVIWIAATAICLFVS